MEYYEVKEWLDAIVDTIRKQHQLETLTTSIRTHYVDDAYFLSKGIEIVSDIMRLQLYSEKREGKDVTYPYHYWIKYRGIKFLQYNEKPLDGGYHGAN